MGKMALCYGALDAPIQTAMDLVTIMRPQLDRYKASLVVANSEMKIPMRNGEQAKEIYPSCSDDVINQENLRQIELI